MSLSPRGGHDDLVGQVALVTGATGGIGRATCVALSAAGAQVVAAGRDAGRLDDTVEATARLGRRAIGLPGVDLRDEAAVGRMAATALDRCGRIDVLVAAAGAPRARFPYPVAALPAQAWDQVIGVNLTGMFLSARAVLPAMMSQGSGQIVNVSSARGATSGRPNAAAYCASKFGVMGLSEALAEEVRDHGIRVHVLLPDAVDTPLIAGTSLASRGSLPPEAVGRLIVDLLTLPSDTLVVNPVLAPFAGAEAIP